MKRHASMNRIYRLVWNHILSTWVVVGENAKGRGKSISGRKLVAAALALSACTIMLPPAMAGPSGGQVVSGAGSIAQTGATTTISQTSQNLSLNWQSFNVAPLETVNFVQPSASALAVNRIFDTQGTQILGQLNANGQIYLINPNGILFGRGAQVNVGGLIASTLDVNDASLSSDTRTFSGNGNGSVINQGTINAATAGYVALLGNHVGNQGVIAAQLGTVALGAGSSATLTFGGNSLLHMQIDRSVLNSLSENGGLIRADGGLVLMNAGAKDALLASVVNNTGVIEARTVNNQNGTIVLLGGMAAGSVNVSGTLDASANFPSPAGRGAGGEGGGFIETSAAHVNIADTAHITTAAPNGKSGTWLIDPFDFNIAAVGGNMTGAVLSNSLLAGNVSILSNSGNSGIAGDVNVNDTVNWAANLLTLNAQNNININSAMNATGTAGLALLYGQGAVALGNASNIITGAAGVVNLPAGTTNFTTLQGSNGVVKNYTVITALGAAGSITGTDLQGMNGNLPANYALGANIAAAGTALWNAGAGFTPVGNATTNFTGTFDGLGHTVSGLIINTPLTSYVGLFGVTSAAASIRNTGLAGGSVVGNTLVGALSGLNSGTLSNVYATASVSGAALNNASIGGLVGQNSGAISNAHATGNVNGGGAVGGLTGKNVRGTITSSYATGIVTGSGNYVGGLVGNNFGGTLNNVYATGNVSGGSWTGGLAGASTTTGNVSNAYATGNVTGGGHVGGLTGNQDGTSTTSNSYATGNVNGIYNTGGLMGTNSGTVNNDYATGIVTGSAGSTAIGGLVGWNYATVSNSYATGNASGSSWVGGLVGNNSSAASTISNSYATGSVSGVTAVGGLVGLNNLGPVTNSFWDTLTSGQLTSAGGTGLTTAQLKTTASFTGWSLANTGGSAAVWRIFDGSTYPLLRSFMTPLTITAAPVSAVYTGLAHTGALVTPTYSPVNPNPALLLGNAYGANTINAGTYAPALYSVQQGYDISYVNGLLTVNPALLSISANAFAKSYDGLAYSGGNGITYAGFVNGETSALLGGALTYTGTSQGAINAGGYAITPGGLTSGNNYTIGYSNGVLTVNPATLTVTANAASRLYGAANPPFSGNVTGFVNGELLANVTTGTEVFSTTAINTSNVGLHDITGAGLIANNGNYVFSQAAANASALTISPTPLSVTANAFAKTYDGLAYSGGNGATYTGLVNGETSAVLGGVLAYTGTSQGAINTGGYILTPGGLTSGNYTIGYNNGTLTVNPALLNVTANAFAKAYDGLAYTGGNGVTYSGFVNTETSAVLAGVIAYGGNSQGAINVGNYLITPSGQTSANYTLSYLNGTLTVVSTTPLLAANVLTSLPNAILNPSSTINVMQPSATAAGGEPLSDSDEKQTITTSIGTEGPTLFIVDGGVRLPDNMFNPE